jgi:hypothetical protein
MKSKKGAMEMSMGTIVTIVLLMSVLVLGIFFIGKVRDLGSGAIDGMNDQVQGKIDELFKEDSDARLVVLPSSLRVKVKRGDDPSGFAFSVMNDEKVQKSFNWEVKAESGFKFEEKCGPTMSEEAANNFLSLSKGEVNIGPSQISNGVAVLFEFPKTAPTCTIPYKLTVDSEGISYAHATVWVTLK